MFKNGITWEKEIKNLKQMTQDGLTFVAIGEYYGVSKQRIKQVFQKYKIEHVGLSKKKIEAENAWALKWGNKEKTGLYEAQRSKYRGKKSQAKGRGVEFSIEFGDITWNLKCPILGIELDYFTEVRKENSPSFDRINPEIGYVKDNVQIISWRANRIKNDGTADEHRLIAEYLTKISKSV